MVKNIERGIVFPWCEIYAIQVSMFMYSSLEVKHACGHSCTYCLWLLSCLQLQSYVLVTETVWPTSLKHLLPGPLWKKNSSLLICKENLTRSILCLGNLVGVFQRPHQGEVWAPPSSWFKLNEAHGPDQDLCDPNLPTSLVPSLAN